MRSLNIVCSLAVPLSMGVHKLPYSDALPLSSIVGPAERSKSGDVWLEIKHSSAMGGLPRTISGRRHYGGTMVLQLLYMLGTAMLLAYCVDPGHMANDPYPSPWTLTLTLKPRPCRDSSIRIRTVLGMIRLLTPTKSSDYG
eukprot:1157969-Pelagomonas_calceolata.AAC.5